MSGSKPAKNDRTAYRSYRERGTWRLDRSRGEDGFWQQVRISRNFVITIVAATVLFGNPARAEPRVLLLRGWFGVFSTGLDSIAEALRAKGIPVEVAGHLRWRTAAEEIVQERSEGNTGPIVLVGHSQGANNVIDMAQVLEAHRVPVALLVTLAPYNQNPIPGNVVQAVNYYQSSGWGAPLVGMPGFRGILQNVDLIQDPTIAHINIDKNADVQADIVRKIVEAVQAR